MVEEKCYSLKKIRWRTTFKNLFDIYMYIIILRNIYNMNILNSKWLINRRLNNNASAFVILHYPLQNGVTNIPLLMYVNITYANDTVWYQGSRTVRVTGIFEKCRFAVSSPDDCHLTPHVFIITAILEWSSQWSLDKNLWKENKTVVSFHVFLELNTLWGLHCHFCWIIFLLDSVIHVLVK